VYVCVLYARASMSVHIYAFFRLSQYYCACPEHLKYYFLAS